MFDDSEGEQLGQVEDEFSNNDSKSKEAGNEDNEPQNEEDEKNEEDDPEEEEEGEGEEEQEEEQEEEEQEEEQEEEEEANEEEKKTKLLANFSEKLQKALMGDLNSDFPDNVKIVRIFTSSTFTGK